MTLPKRKGEPGYDGHPPVHMPARDIPGADRGAIPSLQNDNTDRITPLYRRKIIEPDQFRAAERFQRDWQDMQIVPVSGVSQIGGNKSRGDYTPSQRKIDAAKAYALACKALGVEGAAFLTNIACHGVTVEKTGKCLGFKNEQQSMGAFKACLNMLVGHYGMKPIGLASVIRSWIG